MSFEDIVRSHYFHEVERRRELNAALSIPLGILTALFAAILAMLGSLSLPLNKIELAIGILGGLAAISGLVSVYHAFRSYIGYTYRHPSSMGTLNQWRMDALAKGIAPNRVEQDIRDIMTEQYSAGAERNTENNDRKSGYIHKSSEWLAGCLILTIVSGLPYTYLKIQGNNTTQASIASEREEP